MGRGGKLSGECLVEQGLGGIFYRVFYTRDSRSRPSLVVLEKGRNRPRYKLIFRLVE